MLIVICISLLTACEMLEAPGGRGGPVMGSVVLPGNNNAAPRVANSRSARSITAAEARRLAVANGLTGYKSLPPGIAKNLARGKPLPPGIARRAVPGGMLNSLPRIDGHEWQVSGRDLILIALGTLIVVEVLQNVFE
jgi:hypothetical protein